MAAVGRRAVIALGGNAIAPAGTAGTAEEQTANIGRTMRAVAELIAVDGVEVVLTHGNGPQVGNLLIKNEMARHVVPPMPLDWCVAQTQATIGFTAASALSFELARHGVERPVVPVVSRTLVSLDDPAWQAPSKPIGPYLTDPDEVRARESSGQVFTRIDGQGWRRVVPSPEPLESLDRDAVGMLLDAGAIVIANGGGGIPEVHVAEGPLRGVEAVVDKDLAGALLADELDADVFAILTDVPGVAIDHGKPGERWLDGVTVSELRGWQADGQFRAGSMGPKVEAVCRFVSGASVEARDRAAPGRRAVIAALDDCVAAVRGTAGTQVQVARVTTAGPIE